MKKQKSHATFPQQQAIAARLAEVIEVTKTNADGKAIACRYKSGNTDISIAAALGEGLTSSNVSNIRGQLYGKLHTPKVIQADGEIDELRAAFIKLTQAVEVNNTKHSSEIARLHARDWEICEKHNKLIDQLCFNRVLTSSQGHKIAQLKPVEGVQLSLATSR
jgi:hypothetical protein